MPQINIQHAHELTPDEAVERLQRIVEFARDAYGSKIAHWEESWDGHTWSYSITAMGFSSRGRVTVEPNQVSLRGDLPLSLLLFRGRIESTIREQLSRFLA
ncbi:MAG: polyhydroxyalkanoic acid system family protein [Pirellulales bacterium]|nr:polyhydroxyalkanoic acid system family protein [Pirellulales bacterium]